MPNKQENNMTKEETVDYILCKIYTSNSQTVLTKKEVKKIEGYYKENYSKFDSYSDFLNNNITISDLIGRLNSGSCEIEKQFKARKALQSGILAECVFMQTLAKMLKLEIFTPMSGALYDDIPRSVDKYIDRNKANDTAAARYLYYNKKKTICIVQYGNPVVGDAAVILFGNEVALEIKDMPALSGETDLIYDEEGMLKIPKGKKSKKSIDPSKYDKCIEKFNNDGSIFNRFGRNFKLFPDGCNNEYCLDLLKYFFKCQEVDLIITTTKQDELIALKTDDVGAMFSDGSPLLDASGSEIRTTGKNHLKTPFTPKYLKKILNEISPYVHSVGQDSQFFNIWYTSFY